MRTVIVIPTYNEAENIARLLRSLRIVAREIAGELFCLVVDDNSADGTADIVRHVQQSDPHVVLITGVKRGLGAAYIRGLRQALEVLQADVVFQMDADFSHEPHDVPRLWAAIQRGADFVIGSRYVKGGSIPATWGLHRRLTSRYGNMVARYIAGLYTTRDCTAGFRAIRATLLQRIPLERLKVRGYAFQVALLYEAKIRQANIVEVPVHFVDRTAGASKLGLRDLVEFVIHAWWLRFRSATVFIKFLIVGLSGVGLNLGILTWLMAEGVHKYIASPIAIECSIITNFLLNNFWTFRWRTTHDDIRLRGLKFNVVSLATLLLSYGTFIGLSMWLPHTPPQLPQLLGIIPATLINYLGNTYWTFRDKTPRSNLLVDTPDT